MSERQEKKGSSCCLYGCVTMAVIMAVIVLAVLVVGYSVTKEVKTYISTESVDLPVVELPDRVLKAVQQRVSTFSEGLEAGGDDSVAIALTAEQINGLITSDTQLGTFNLSKLKGVVHISMPKDKLVAKVSIPLGIIIPDFPPVAGKFLNGEATLKLNAVDGVPSISLESMEAGGKPMPKVGLDMLSSFVDGAFNASLQDPTGATTPPYIEQLEVKGGRLHLRAIPPAPVTATPAGPAEVEEAEAVE